MERRRGIKGDVGRAEESEIEIEGGEENSERERESEKTERVLH